MRGPVPPPLAHRRGAEGGQLRLEQGELVGLIGPNGAGKSTTIKILSGILRADARAAARWTAWSPGASACRHVARIGVVFGQRTQLWWDLPVIEGFDLLRDIYRVPQDRYRRASATSWWR